MSTARDFVLGVMKKYGKKLAEELQEKASEMTGTELYKEKVFIPSFASACGKKNMLERPIGFVCQSSAGRVVKLLQHYDSNIYTQEPEELPAQWGFVWSNDPDYALDFVAISTSPYMKGNCCLENGEAYCSIIDNNVWRPSEYPQGWEWVEKTK